MFGKRKLQQRIDDAYGDGFSDGLEMGFMAAETRIKNMLAQMGGYDHILDEIDRLDVQDDD